MTLAYLLTFTQTCVIELPFYYWFLRDRWRPIEIVGAVVALNALTHPLVFFGFMTFKGTILSDILAAEIFAFGLEALACRYFLGLSHKRAWAAATLANLASWQLGSMLTYSLWIRS